MAIDYINANYPAKAEFGFYVWYNTKLDLIRRRSWLAVINTYGFAKKLIGRN